MVRLSTSLCRETNWHMTAWFKRGAALRINPTSSLLTSTCRIKRGFAEAGWERSAALNNPTHDDSRQVKLELLGLDQMQVKLGSTEVKSWAHWLSVCQQWVFVKRADPHREDRDREGYRERECVCEIEEKKERTQEGERERTQEGERKKEKKCCHCTFHRSWRRAWGGECVNIGEGPFARLIKGLDAERIRGRLIKPLDFVCVAWSFIQGYKSAMTGTWKERERERI